MNDVITLSSSKVTRSVVWLITTLGRVVLAFIADIKGFLHFVQEVLRWTFRRPFRVQLLFQQMEFIGNQSLNILM
ncbi:hypothetical protein E3A20_12930, partial [Planctomyces bekefii]